MSMIIRRILEFFGVFLEKKISLDGSITRLTI